MRISLKAAVAVAFAFSLTLAIGAQQGGLAPITISPLRSFGPGTSDADRVSLDKVASSSTQSPVTLIGVMSAPTPIASADLLFVDQPSGRLFVADRTNKAIDIFDAVNSVYIGKVPGFYGLVNAAAGITSQGPNGVVVTPDNKIWAADGLATLRVADLNLAVPAIIQSIVVGPPADGRADELAYDPVEHLIAVGFDAATPPYVAIVSADTYQVLKKIPFPDATGMEEPEWDAQLHRFVVNVPSSPPYLAVIDPVKLEVTKKLKAPPGCVSGITGLAVTPFQRLFVSGCGGVFMISAIDGHVITASIPQVGAGGDQVWFNAGDGRVYLTTVDTTTRIQSLIAVDAASGTWVQSVPAPGTRNLAAYEGNNHIFTGVRPVAGVADVCTPFGVTGCIAVFAHAGGQ